MHVIITKLLKASKHLTNPVYQKTCNDKHQSNLATSSNVARTHTHTHAHTRTHSVMALYVGHLLTVRLLQTEV